jgi:RHS repeat-associated protein
MLADRQPERPKPPAERRSAAPPPPSAEAPPRQGTLPAITVPKGGGALRGIGEKFQVHPATGTAALSVPVTASPGRAGAGPALALHYDSGAGNGPFGLGWSLDLPAVARKTEKGLPRYRDADESDVFILSGAEDLVPVLVQDAGGHWTRRRDDAPPYAPDYRVDFYRPRTEGLFARIERWTRRDTGETHWRSLSRDNVTTLYGTDDTARVADPDNPVRVFRWLITATIDDRGNVIWYDYQPEDAANVDPGPPYERNRLGPGAKFANRYLKRVCYGNRTPYVPGEDLSQRTDWCFELVLDYGEHDDQAPTPVGVRPWPCRLDPFSTYTPGFEVRTYRLCRRLLMFHHFADLGDTACLVVSTDLTHQPSPLATYLTSVTHRGYRRVGQVYRVAASPPLEFRYSEAQINSTPRELDADSAADLAAGLQEPRRRWFDLDGDGAPGLLTDQAGGWFFKRNWSPTTATRAADGTPDYTARLGTVQLLAPTPTPGAFGDGRQQFLDLNGDGLAELAQFGPPLPGYFRRSPDAEWDGFAAFQALPNLNWTDPNLKFVDLTGDGLADLLLTEDDALRWYAALGPEGFDDAEWLDLAGDEERGPRLLFADGTDTVFLADMSGDGLQDLVRVRNGEVSYWPNLGYGRFGAKVTMAAAPAFDAPELFEPKRLRLADVDGSGTADLIYLGGDAVRLWLNQSGNGWGAAQVLEELPPVDAAAAVDVVDLLGNGTACLVWSSPLPCDVDRPLRYVDLLGGEKPHLLVRVINNLGAETRIDYAPSTKFALQDRGNGNPWLTRLPFPVQVVERVVTHDRVSRNRFVTRYAYHHGYYDGVEREFRGFGLVEQWDTEAFALFADAFDDLDDSNVDATTHVPPVWTRTWFHTGAFGNRGEVTSGFASLPIARGGYYREPLLSDAEAAALLLADTVLPPGLNAEEEREARRALKGSLLRQEVYALDHPDQAQPPYPGLQPYRVTESNYTICPLQPLSDNRNAVFHVHPRETVTYEYERYLVPATAAAGAGRADPRVLHTVTLAVTDYGDVRQSVSVGYGRQFPGDPSLTDDDRAKQQRLLMTYTDTVFTNGIDQPDAYRASLPWDENTYEVTGLTPSGLRFSFEELQTQVPAAAPLEYDDTPDASPHRRRFARAVTLYRADDLSADLATGVLQPRALTAERYEQVFSQSLPGKTYLPRVTDPLPTLLADAGYVPLPAVGDAGWWAPSGCVFYSPGASDLPSQELAFALAHFFLPHRRRDPFGNLSYVTYDDPNWLVPATMTDAVGNVTAARIDYRVLQPNRVTDPNGNQTDASFDTRGTLALLAVMGKDGEGLGDVLPADPDTLDLSPAQLQSFFADPLGQAPGLLGTATTRFVYDVDRFQNDPAGRAPVYVATLSRERHVSDPGLGGPSPVQVGFSYGDGFGRVIQKKGQVEPGPLTPGGPVVTPRWVGSGWTVFNNKGNPVQQYEPFFSATHDFEFGRKVGVTSTWFYDPLQRAVSVLHPEDTYEKTVFDPWREAKHDANDTALLDPRTDPDVQGFMAAYLASLPAGWQPWLRQRIDPAHPPADVPGLGDEQAAAVRTLPHAGTPTLTHFDTLGRVFLTVADNGALGTYATRVELDIEGNQLQVHDARGRLVQRTAFAMGGRHARVEDMDAGTRWHLPDVLGKPRYDWDSRDHRVRHDYDVDRRPTGLYVRTGAGPAEPLAELTVYGEGQGPAANHRGRVYQQFDAAGVVTHMAYDFKGNLVASSRQLLQNYQDQVDWAAAANPLESDIFVTRTLYDALNRVTQRQEPHASAARVNVVRPGYNEANLLQRVDVWLGRTSEPTTLLDPATADRHAVTNIVYDAKGRRSLIAHGNAAVTVYGYDPKTFRLTRLTTTRPPTPDTFTVQDLTYTYDPVGNVIRIQDNADIQNVVFFNNRRVDPTADYDYEAVYRLNWAKGREQLGLDGGGHLLAPAPSSWTDAPHVGLPHPGDGNAIGRYTEVYTYDAAGNLQRLDHQADSGTWSRTFTYQEPSLLEATYGNRLSRATVGGVTETFTYDPHGSMTSMGHLPLMESDFQDRLHVTQQQAVSAGPGPKTYHVYDADGQRVRKVTESLADAGPRRREERLYLGGVELHRVYEADSTTVKLERETLHVQDGTRRVALVETRTLGTDGGSAQLVRYQFANHLGSAVLELDDRAQVITYEEYSPFGGTTYQAAASLTETPKRYRYTGKERDAETGLCYHGARHYAPWLARWVSCDPLGVGGGTNLFVYAADNPLTFVDPTGRQANNVNDLLTFIHAQAGFSAGQIRPPTFNPRSASAFGTLAHAEATRVLDELKALNVPGAERIYSEVRVVGGVVTQIGGTPGGPKGAHNIDILVTKPGDTLSVGQSISGGVAESIGDLKYGGGTIDPKYAVHGSPLQTITGRTQASETVATATGQIAKTEQTAAQAGQVATADASLAQAGAAVAKADAGVAKAGAAVAKVEAGLVQAGATAAKVETGLARAGAVAKGLAPAASKLAGAAKALAPAARVVGKVAGPLGVAVSAAGIATATNRLDRVQATADTAAAAVGFAGPLGAAFSTGYTVGGLADKGIEWASKKAVGVDLSPSNIIASGLTAADQLVSKAFADPSKPAYTQTLGWKIADYFGL